MTNASIGYTNYVVLGTLSDPFHPAGLASSNLAGPRGMPPWQTNGVGSAQHFDIDSGTSAHWDAIALFRSNLTAAATIMIDIGTTQGGTDKYNGSFVAGNVVPGYGQTIILLPSTQIGRWCRVSILDTANPDGFIRVGLAFAGPLFTPANNFNYDDANGFQDDSPIQTTKGGSEYDVPVPEYRTGSMVFDWLSEDEKFSQVNELDRIKGVRGNVLIIPNPGSAYMNQEAIFGRIKTSTAPTRPTFAGFSKQYDIRERL